jgi:glycosyltransferase involved in cell wall biosynthesis
MNALIVGNFLSASVGIRSVAEEVTDRLEGRGWKLITTSSRRTRIMRLPDMVSTTWARRHDYQAAAVEVYSGAAFFWAEAVCTALRCAGKPYMLVLHGGNLPLFAKTWPRRVGRLLRGANVVATPSAYLASELNRFGVEIRMLPNAIELARYPFSVRAHPSPRLVWLRAFHRIYNPGLAVGVLHRLHAEFPEIRLIMAGPDKGDGTLQQVQALGRELGVSSRVEFPGALQKLGIPAFLSAGDILLNSTDAESFGVGVLEALACGLCVVSTNVGGLPYWLNHEENCLLVGRDNPDEMASAVRRLLTDSQLAERLSRQGRALAAQYDWSSVLPKWEALLRETAEGRSHGNGKRETP